MEHLFVIKKLIEETPFKTIIGKINELYPEMDVKDKLKIMDKIVKFEKEEWNQE